MPTKLFFTDVSGAPEPSNHDEGYSTEENISPSKLLPPYSHRLGIALTFARASPNTFG